MTGEPVWNDGYIEFNSGRLSCRDVDALFRTMPYELDYINADDQYVWYSPNPWRDDGRLQQRLNHNVNGCHPKRVLPMVHDVIAQLKSGKKDMIESPQIMNGDRTLIRYYAVRTVNDHYLGTLQVTEDVEHIAQLTEQHAFEHGIVEGRIPDATTGASQHK